MQRIVFRADASPSIGGGHVMRCLALADGLRRDGAECWFASAPESLRTVPALPKSGHRYVELDPSGDADALRRSVPEGCDWLVVDHYGWSAIEETRCRPWTGKILVIDDLANRMHDCDLLLDQTFGRAEADYRDLVPPGSNLLVGSQYALLRPEFAVARPVSLACRQSGRLRHVLVSMGLGDPLNATQMILEGIIESRLSLSADVVLGPSAPGLSAVREFVDRHNDAMSLHVATENMADLMRRADLCFGAPGSTSWERCCLGLPTILTIIADNQGENCRRLIDDQAAISLGLLDGLSPSVVADTLLELNGKPQKLIELARRSAVICDGRGMQRVAMGMHPESAADGASVWLRPAASDDLEMTHAWQVQPDARRFMRNKTPPTLQEHAAWFAARLGDPDCLLSIIVCDGQPVGSLRLDRVAARSFEISLVIGSPFRARGIGLAALSLAARLVPESEIRAEVLAGNAGSEALFTKAGFMPRGYGWRHLPAYASNAQLRDREKRTQ